MANEKTKAQSLYDRLQALKRDRASKVQERREGLEAIARYAEIQKEQKALGEQKKAVTADFDEQNESLKTDIESLKTKIEGAEFTLTGAILDDMMAGREVNIFKMTSAGDRKKISFEMRARFKQMSLGI